MSFETLLDDRIINDLAKENYDSEFINEIWDKLINDAPIHIFDFQKHFVFESLPAFFVNQNLCVDEPISPKNEELYLDYQVKYEEWKEHHKICFRCKYNFKFATLLDETVLENEKRIQYLPKWIENQCLFENELVNVPPTVEEFYSFIVLGNLCCDNIQQSWSECVQKEQVVNYFEKIKKDYSRQLNIWKSGLSLQKQKRYEKYCEIRKEYLKKINQLH